MPETLPSVSLTAFSCPYCGAFADQTWFSLLPQPIQNDQRRPIRPQGPALDFVDGAEGGSLRLVNEWTRKMHAGEIFFSDSPQQVAVFEAYNIYLSRCFGCKQNALWHGQNLVVPRPRVGSAPNPDLDEDIRIDIDEARSILDASPRGAAALLRLAVQKLCRQVGQSGKNLDNDIQSLVDKGMDPHLQQAFDVVRVIGNESVHPGELDLRDDRETAITLIDLINIAAQELISNKKAIAAIYSGLPRSKLQGIAARAKGAAAKLEKK